MRVVITLLALALALMAKESSPIESAGQAPYNCSKYKTKYAQTNCADFEAAYNSCISGKTKLSISCEDLQKKDLKWLAKNDIAANDKLATSGNNTEREYLAKQWADSMSQGYYRHVKSKVSQVKGGYAIYAVHDFFTRHQFSIGKDTDIASAFIHANADDIKKLNIVRIGVQSDRGESAWFDLK